MNIRSGGSVKFFRRVTNLITFNLILCASAGLKRLCGLAAFFSGGFCMLFVKNGYLCDVEIS